MTTILAGVDIGGTKCAVSLGILQSSGTNIEIMRKISFPTPAGPHLAISKFIESLQELLRSENVGSALSAIGISCGGPLDSRTGRIYSPPNLPGWDDIDIIHPFSDVFHVPVGVQNDANACALAEWKWGAGQGTQNMVFLTFGTGMGAGLILNGQLYAGTNDLAGEVGHIRLSPTGPIGFGKAGSFEGFCSGGGIAQLAKSMLEQHVQKGKSSLLASVFQSSGTLTAKDVAEAAQSNDELALTIFHQVGTQLGKGLAILIDLLNPEVIVIGSIYARQEALMKASMVDVIEAEAIPAAWSCCRVLPAKFGDYVGDYAALSVAMHLLEKKKV